MNRTEVEALVQKKAQEDAAFRQEFLLDPKGAIKRSLNVNLPAGLEIRVVEESATAAYVVLPPAMGEIADMELEQVAGGACGVNLSGW